VRGVSTLAPCEFGLCRGGGTYQGRPCLCADALCHECGGSGWHSPARVCETCGGSGARAAVCAECGEVASQPVGNADAVLFCSSTCRAAFRRRMAREIAREVA